MVKFDSSEMKNLIKSSLDFWLTDGEYQKNFQKKCRVLICKTCTFSK